MCSSNFLVVAADQKYPYAFNTTQSFYCDAIDQGRLLAELIGPENAEKNERLREEHADACPVKLAAFPSINRAVLWHMRMSG
ncbi:hypothetical protein BK662_07245 [Pseudomonas frederiksbergensis]|uniref:Uncharacterized protein n=1 Tax=Pseudomonas frederiksbergensis TaxID=104087 RepID=A0A423HVS3_9PSED|nr:hypothetical protein BK662_07245 [Pseudomonas frederiksbergensis]